MRRESLSEASRSGGPSEGRGVPSPVPEDVLARLGVDPDESLAAEAGVSIGCIQRHRTMRGISKQKRAGVLYVHLLGTMSDADLAAKLGMNVAAVSVRRRRRGVPRFVAPPPVAEGPETE